MTRSRTAFDRPSHAMATPSGLNDQVVRVRVHSASHATAVMLLSSMALMAGLLGLYFVKSAAGIDLMQGPSMFHALFY